MGIFRGIGRSHNPIVIFVKENRLWSRDLRPVLVERRWRGKKTQLFCEGDYHIEISSSRAPGTSGGSWQAPESGSEAGAGGAMLGGKKSYFFLRAIIIPKYRARRSKSMLSVFLSEKEYF